MSLARLGGIDAGLLHLEFGQQSMNVCVLIELDTTTMPDGYDFHTLQAYLLRQLDALPEFRVKLADARLNLDNPVWLDDNNFDLSAHVHRIGLPHPGGRQEITSLAAQFMAAPLDRDRPLWQLWVIEDHSRTDGRLHLLLKQHHAMMDGKTESGLMARMCTTGIDSPVPEFIQGPGDASQCTIAIDGAARFAARPWHVIRTVIPTLARALVNSVRHSLSGQAAPGPFRVPRTPFNGKATARRTIAHVQLDLADVKKVKNHFGVKVNDVVMALLSGALRDYLIDLDELPDASLIALVPMAIDDRGQDFGGNQLAAAFCSLESQVADPVERLNAIAQASSMAKNRAVELGPTLIRDTLQYVSPRLMGWAMRLYLKSGLTERRPIHNISVTNVPGGVQIPV